MFRQFIVLTSIFLSISILIAKNVGETAPEFTGKSFSGNEIKLADFQNKVIILDFWASWCGPCRKEMPFLIELHKKYKDKDFEILAINIDEKESKAQKFLKKLETQPNFPIIWDKNSKISPMYDLETMPTTYLIDKKGNIIFIHKGFKDSYKEDFYKEIEILLNEK